jgi:hypothetical protein
LLHLIPALARLFKIVCGSVSVFVNITILHPPRNSYALWFPIVNNNTIPTIIKLKITPNPINSFLIPNELNFVNLLTVANDVSLTTSVLVEKSSSGNLFLLKIYSIFFSFCLFQNKRRELIAQINIIPNESKLYIINETPKLTPDSVPK